MGPHCKAIVLAGLILALVSGGEPPFAATAPLEVRIHDHREALDDFRSVLVTIPAVALHPAGRPRAAGWRSLPATVPRVDLTLHQVENPATIFRGTVEPGAYDAIRLEVSETRATAQDGRAVPVLWASGAVAARFTPNVGARTIITFDLTIIDMSDHPPKGYELHVKGVSVTAGAP